MPHLTLRFKKKTDVGVAIRYVRADGSSTWSSGSGVTVRFFVGHDLGHYAVETVLRFDRAFLGLLADGWDLDDFGAPWPKGTFSPGDLPQLMLAEFLTSAFDNETALGEPLTADAFNALAASEWKKHGLPSIARVIRADELSEIRRARETLLRAWDTLPPGETMELRFGETVRHVETKRETNNV